MATRDSHRLANEPDLRESDTDSQGGPHMGLPQAMFLAGLLYGRLNYMGDSRLGWTCKRTGFVRIRHGLAHPHLRVH